MGLKRARKTLANYGKLPEILPVPQLGRTKGAWGKLYHLGGAPVGYIDTANNVYEGVASLTILYPMYYCR